MFFSETAYTCSLLPYSIFREKMPLLALCLTQAKAFSQNVFTISLKFLRENILESPLYKKLIVFIIFYIKIWFFLEIFMS